MFARAWSFPNERSESCVRNTAFTLFVVPEPGTVLLAGLGLLAAARKPRRRVSRR